MAKQTKGYCKYCAKEYTRTGIVKHLVSCKERKAKLEDLKEEVSYYELMLYGKYNKDYWLVIQINENATLQDLDQFIRDIWVECCGHLSAFEIYGQRYEAFPQEDCFWGEPAKSMDCKLKEIFECGMKIEYEYDYGSTTEIIIDVKDYYEAPTQKEKVTILSRNKAPQFLCSQCGENIADWVDPTRFYEEDPFLCEECLERYEEGEMDEESEEYGVNLECLLPICNSPRMGVCGYEGSSCYPDEFEPDKKM